MTSRHARPFEVYKDDNGNIRIYQSYQGCDDEVTFHPDQIDLLVWRLTETRKEPKG